MPSMRSRTIRLKLIVGHLTPMSRWLRIVEHTKNGRNITNEHFVSRCNKLIAVYEFVSNFLLKTFNNAKFIVDNIANTIPYVKFQSWFEFKEAIEIPVTIGISDAYTSQVCFVFRNTREKNTTNSGSPPLTKKQSVSEVNL